MKTFNLQFGGFYYSIHDELIDSMLESYFSDDSGEPLEHPDNIDYQIIFTEYCNQLIPLYKEFMSDEYSLDISLKFIHLDSPREYNFTTDSMLCDVTEKDFKKLKNYFLKDAAFIKYANDKSKSRDGFISFYDGIKNIKTDDSILLQYIFMYVTSEISETFLDLYDTNNMYEMLYSLDFLTNE